MTIRKKTLITIGTIMLVMIVLIYYFTRLILLDSFITLEDQSIRTNAEQAQGIIDDEIARIRSIAGDWAPWDDTYEFVADANEAYIADNLNISTLANLGINFMLFVDVSGRVVFGKAIDLESEAEIPFLQSMKDHIAANSYLLNHRNENSSISGIVLLPETPVILASAPILTSHFEGPIRGTLIVGRYFDTYEINRMIEKVKLSLKLHRLDDPQIPSEIQNVQGLLKKDQSIHVKRLNDEAIAVYLLIRDIYEKPVLMVGIDQHRNVYVQGLTSLKYFVLSLLLVGAVFIAATLLLLERVIIVRLGRLNENVQRISRSGNLADRVAVGGKDELGGLANEINAMLEALRISTERDRTILENIEDAYFETDLSGNFIFFNDALCRLIGQGRERIVGSPFSRYMDEANKNNVENRFNALYQTERAIKTLDLEIIRNDGSRCNVDIAVSLILDAAGEKIGFRGIARDVTERKMTEEKLAYMAYHDELTGLMNRKAFHEILNNELSYAQRYRQERALFYIDLDKFKQVNDTIGHAAGDLLLQEVASRLQNSLRESDCIFRLGGDEFTVILRNPNQLSPNVVSQRIYDSLSKPYEIKENSIDFVRPSIGVGIYPKDGNKSDALISYADNAMYEAKREKSGCVMHQT